MMNLDIFLDAVKHTKEIVESGGSVVHDSVYLGDPILLQSKLQYGTPLYNHVKAMLFAARYGRSHEPQKPKYSGCTDIVRYI